MIKYAAIKKTETEIYIGWHHHHILWCMPMGYLSDCAQGFVTTGGRFVDREEGLKIATEHNQIVKKHGYLNELFSEDMWRVRDDSPLRFAKLMETSDFV